MARHILAAVQMTAGSQLLDSALINASVPQGANVGEPRYELTALGNFGLGLWFRPLPGRLSLYV